MKRLKKDILSQSIQDYLKAIYKIECEKGNASTSDLSKLLSVSNASVTGMLKKLNQIGLIEYNSYKGAKLTHSGKKIALEIIRHHRLLELYLKEILGYPLNKVHNEACKLEHHISEELSDKISEMMGNPKYDPHGHPIPSKDGKIENFNEFTLYEADINTLVIIRRVSDNDHQMLEYMENLSLLPGKTLKILEKEPFLGSVHLELDNVIISISYEIARNIFVEYV